MSGPDMRPPADNAHPLVKFLHKQCVAQMISRRELGRRAGLGEDTLRNWWEAKHAVILQNIEAALGVLGYGLTQQILPPRVTAADIRVGESYRVRCGMFAHVTGCDGERITGYLIQGGIGLTWDMAGRRIPRGGEDPMDMMLTGARAA
jgi:hypothetical protein